MIFSAVFLRFFLFNLGVPDVLQFTFFHGLTEFSASWECPKQAVGLGVTPYFWSGMGYGREGHSTTGFYSNQRVANISLDSE